MLYVPCVDGIKALRITTTGTPSFVKVWDGPGLTYALLAHGGAIYAATTGKWWLWS